MPRTMFSVTVKLCTNLKCWCTIPIPNAFAVLGLSILTSVPRIPVSYTHLDAEEQGGAHDPDRCGRPEQGHGDAVKPLTWHHADLHG